MSIDTSKRYINGPVNVVRLQGKIGTVEKVVYLLFDVHNDVYVQTSCEDLLSTNIDKYLADSWQQMDSGKKKYDFVFEINPNEIYADNSVQKMRDKYIWQTVHLFRSVYGQQQDKSNNAFHNIRLHYFDVREYIGHGTSLYELYNAAANMMSYDYNRSTYNYIIENLNYVSENLKMIVDADAAKKPTTAVKLIGQPVDQDKKFVIVQHILDKIKNVYSHDNVKKPILRQYYEIISRIVEFKKNIDHLVQTMIDLQPEFESTKLTDHGTEYYSYGMPRIIHVRKFQPIIETLAIYPDQFLAIFVDLTDLYMLRRILDKDYITNVVAYSGALHSKNYVKTLVRDFNFEITHVSFSRKPINELNREIKTTKSPDKTIKWLFDRDYVTQCSDMTSFPANFN